MATDDLHAWVDFTVPIKHNHLYDLVDLLKNF